MLREHLEHLIKFSLIFVWTRCINREKNLSRFFNEDRDTSFSQKALDLQTIESSFFNENKNSSFSHKAVELEIVEGYEDVPAHMFTLFFCSSYFRDRKGTIKARWTFGQTQNSSSVVTLFCRYSCNWKSSVLFCQDLNWELAEHLQSQIWRKKKKRKSSRKLFYIKIWN